MRGEGEKYRLTCGSNSPLHVDWAGPFAEANARAMIPEFTLPAAYTVQVPPLHSKMASFSDETLFVIFYQQPGDIAQEWAAAELYVLRACMDVACSDGVCIGRYERDWRWHKKLQQWMMKAKEFGDPQQLPSQREERGYYYFFDVNNWRRDRVSGMVVVRP